MEQRAGITTNSTEATTVTRSYDRTIAGLYRQWVTSETALSNTTAQGTVDTGQAEVEVQAAILGKLIQSQAKSISDVLLKLHVWRDMVAPDGEVPDWVSPSDELALSAIADLETHAKLG